jgi:hypothetical protein
VNSKISEILLGVATMILFAVMFNFLIVNWALGCGETIYTATGSHPGECVGLLDLFRY